MTTGINLAFSLAPLHLLPFGNLLVMMKHWVLIQSSRDPDATCSDPQNINRLAQKHRRFGTGLIENDGPLGTRLIENRPTLFENSPENLRSGPD